MDDSKVEIINEMINLTTQLEYIWPFHPDNPEKIDVEEEFKFLMEKLKQLKYDVEEE
jgi:hypothetical protein|tara:strand:+ start:193 stop:363 length:171 start_codon:yes stop_codon:yes gene_type:complete